MPFDFPATPALNQRVTSSSGAVWRWDGVKWVSASGQGTTTVTSWNTRIGDVTMTQTDVTDALTFIPYDATNPDDFISQSTADSLYLNLSGGTLTGPLLLAADPTAPLGAATKQSVDAVAATVPTPSDTPPLMDGTAATGSSTNYAREGHVHPTDTSRYDASNPAGYISDAVSDAFSYGRHANAWAQVLPLSGGTLTGALVLAADPAGPLQPVTLQYLQARNYLASISHDATLSGNGTAATPLAVVQSYTMWSPYSGAASYVKNQLTRDGSWTMVANKNTTDRPAPQPSGPETDLLPAWIPITPNARASYTVYNEWTVSSGGWIEQYGAGVLDQNFGAQHVITLMVNGVVQDTFTGTPTGGAYYSHDTTPIIVNTGSVIRVTLQVTQVSNNQMYWQESAGLFATPPTYCSLARGCKDGGATSTTAYGCHLLFTPGTASPDWDVVAFGGTVSGVANAGLPEAPTDGATYGRQGSAKTWLSVLPITGGTLTGALTLAADPASAMQPVTLQYLQAHTISGNQTITHTGDVTGSGATSITNTVVGLQGRPVAATAPTANQVLTWSGTAWGPAAGGGGGASVTVSDTPPASPTQGALWWDSVGGQFYIYYTDPNSSAWVNATNAGLGTVTVSDTAPANPALNSMWFCSSDLMLYLRFFDGNSTQWIPAVNIPVSVGEAPNDTWSYLRHANAWQSGGGLSGNLGVGIQVPALQSVPHPEYGGAWLFSWGISTQNMINNAYYDGTNWRYQRANEGISYFSTGAGNFYWALTTTQGNPDDIATPGQVMSLDTAGLHIFPPNVGDPLYLTSSPGYYCRTMSTVTNLRTWSAGCEPNNGNYVIADETGGAFILVVSCTAQNSTVQAAQGRLQSFGGSNPSVSVWNSAWGACCMFLDSSGTIGFGTADQYGTPQNYNYLHIQSDAQVYVKNLLHIVAGYGITYSSGAYSSGNTFLLGWSNVVGGLATISVDNGGAVYSIANGSDARIKEEIEDSTFDSLDAINKIQVREFFWKTDMASPHDLRNARVPDGMTKVRVGMIAQEVERILPEAVRRGDDTEDVLGRVWGIENNIMEAALIGAIQQLTARVAALEARLAV